MKRVGIVLIMLFATMALTGPLSAAPALASEKGKIHILFMEPFPPNVKLAQEYIDVFKKENPGTEITLEPLGFGNFMAKVSALKAAGNPPDLVFTIPGHMWNFQKEGWLEPLDDVIAAIGGDDYFEPLPGYVKYEGHYWGIPQTSYTMHLEYRKDLFEAKGLPTPPRTWDDLLKAAKALTEDLNGDGKIDRYGIVHPLKNDYALGVSFLGYLWGNGGHILNEKGEVVFNSPETVQALKFFKELFKYAPPGASNYSWMELISTFVQDKAAVTIFSALKPLDEMIKAKPEVAKNVGICAIPTRTADQKPRARWANMSWLLTNESKNKEMAKKFLKFWFDADRLVKFYANTPIFTVPGEKPIINGKAYWEIDLIKQYGSAIKGMIELNKESGLDPVMENPGVLQPMTSIINQRLLVSECVQEVVLGKATAEEAAAKAHKKMVRLMKKKSN